MDARVNDFLNEINEIAPLNDNKTESVWEKCYDDDSGYYYYWNTKTNEVTWDMPPDYHGNKTKTRKSCNLYIPPRTTPLFPSTGGLLPPVSDAIKIYKIGECTDTVASSSITSVVNNDLSGCKEETKFSNGKLFRKKGDSTDEKIVLISSYKGDSESDDEKQSKENTPMNSSKTSSVPNSDEDEDVDILKKIHRKATEFSLSSENEEKSKARSDFKRVESKETGFSLVVGYSDSEEESDNESCKTNFPIAPPPEENKVSHSTLFPVTKPIDVKDFEDNSTTASDAFDSKAFQRKRRIGVALINTGKKNKTSDESERKGLGFSGENSSEDNVYAFNTGNIYPGFKSGGIMFVKTDVLHPPSSNNANINTENSEDSSKNVLKEIDDTYTALKEKLRFLNDGREEASPVQVMLIQLETLYTALKSGNLKQNYVRNWLCETCSDLIKLEKDTTPEGWLLQWDRTHKRYYYQNAATGESQWEYPQTDVTVCDEAMDICTTPPPSGAEETIHTSPPLPPVIGSPSPPPSKISEYRITKKVKCDVPLLTEPKQVVSAATVADKYNSSGEPLPPGIEGFDATNKPKDVKDDMNDVLNSFYSDIAAIETSNSPPVANVNEDAKADITQDTTQEQLKKKKKTKVKLAQGIAMKKKGVSKLVEKWKNVQMSYND